MTCMGADEKVRGILAIKLFRCARRDILDAGTDWRKV